MNKLYKYLIIAPILGLGMNCSDNIEYSDKCETTIQGQKQDLLVLPGVVRVKLAKGVDVESVRNSTRSTSKTGISTFDETLEQYSIKSIKPFFPRNPKFKEAEERHGLERWFEIELLDTKNGELKDETVQLIETCRTFSLIECVEGAFETVYYGSGKAEVVTDFAFQTAGLMMNDPMLKKQWHYDQGDVETLPDANISLFKAWEYTSGDPSVIVAVNDSGIDVEHEDLVDNLWINYTELNGESYTDDDGNGYNDDIYGYNFVRGTGVCDKGEHATHVAGTISAANNNGKGICGIAGGSGKKDGVKLMSCQIMNAQGAASVGGNAAKALKYSAEMGALISQNSWGYGSPDVKEQVLLDAIDYFIEEAGNFPGSLMKGGIFITSSGNLNSGGKYYPGYYENSFTVSSTDYMNKKSSFSNFGSHVALSAPGGSDTKPTNEKNILSTLPNNEYGYMAGTSMACPHVSGIAALLISRYGGSNFTVAQLKELLLQSCSDLSVTEPTYSVYMGKGVVNAFEAMKIGANGEKNIAPEKVSDLAWSIVNSTTVDLSWTATKDEDHGTPSRYRVYINNKPISSTSGLSMEEIIVTNPFVGKTITHSINNLVSRDSCYVVVYGVDRAGNISKQSNQVSFKLKSSNTQLTASPSTVKTTTKVTWGNDHTGQSSITLLNITGTTVFSQQVNTESNECIIDLSFLAPGKYTLQLKSDTKTAKTQIVKY